MNFQNSPYIWPLLLSTVITLGLALYAWRNRQAPGAKAMALMFVAMSLWSLANGQTAVRQSVARTSSTMSSTSHASPLSSSTRTPDRWL